MSVGHFPAESMHVPEAAGTNYPLVIKVTNWTIIKFLIQTMHAATERFVRLLLKSMNSYSIAGL